MTSLILEPLFNGYRYLFVDLADPRSKDYFLMGSPFPIAALLGFYFYFVFTLGPRFMKSRAPFDLERVLVVYNSLQIVACVYIIIKGFRAIMSYSWRCAPVDYSNSEIAVDVVLYVWAYFILKLIDLLDTVFFILRKKYNQASFLHVYHHVLMCSFAWLFAKYMPGGHSTLSGYLNCIIHTVMYSYYLLTAWNKEYKKNVWWKKHITHLQFIQFFILVVYYGQIFFQPNCTYPKWAAVFWLVQNLIMIVLFGNFYIKNYLRPQVGIKSTNAKSK